jgi:hypothetical protein
MAQERPPPKTVPVALLELLTAIVDRFRWLPIPLLVVLGVLFLFPSD